MIIVDKFLLAFIQILLLLGGIGVKDRLVLLVEDLIDQFLCLLLN